MEENFKKSYESVFVFSSKLGQEPTKGLVQKFKDLIETSGTLEGFDEWGLKKFSYPIEKETEGYYVLYTFSSVPEFPKELDRIAKITDGVLRHLIIRKDPIKKRPVKQQKKEEPQTMPKEVE